MTQSASTRRSRETRRQFAHRAAESAPARGTRTGHHERDAAGVSDGSRADRCRRPDGELELGIVEVCPRFEVEQDHEPAATRLLELSHHEGARLRRAAPVDVASVVAGHVLAQGVEGDVARGEVTRGKALEVTDEAGAERADRHRAGVHPQLCRLGPDDLAPHEADGVGTHGSGGADRHDPPPVGGNRELLVERAAARQTRKHALEHPRPDRELDLHSGEPAATGIRRDEPREGRFAHDDAGGRNEQPDLARAPPDQPERRHRDEHDESPPDGDDLEKTPAVPDAERDDRRGDDRPAERRDDSLHRTSPRLIAAAAVRAPTSPRSMTTASRPRFLASSGMLVRVWAKVTRPAS